MTRKSEQNTLKDLFYGTVTVRERGQVVVLARLDQMQDLLDDLQQ
jgi:hypothetical protein